MPIEAAGAVVSGLTEDGALDLVLYAADQMAHRVATQRVTAQQDNIDQQDQRSDADSKRCHACRGILEPEGVPGVKGQDDQKSERKIQEVAVNVLQDQGQRALAAIVLARLPDGTRRRIGP